jgi:hypothetical protein
VELGIQGIVVLLIVAAAAVYVPFKLGLVPRRFRRRKDVTFIPVSQIKRRPK